MELDRNQLYKTMLARDKRADGRFYVGVHTTGIYCRPICPARPKLKNISFYRSQAEAEKAGFRPCLRCRPDLSPQSLQWDGIASIVGRALKLINQGKADEINADDFAAKLGVSDRHLRRLFEEHLGASPLEVVLSKRLHLAKQLLLETKMPVTEVAFASGFQSIRRFNDAFAKTFKATPSEVRIKNHAKTKRNSPLISLNLPYIAPFDWDYLYLFLKNHHMAGVETFIDGCYTRLFTLGKHAGWFEVSHDKAHSRLRLRINCPDVTQLRQIVENVKDLFDLRLNPHHIVGDLGGKDFASRMIQKGEGIRIPGCWDPFETAVCIILGQVVSVDQARQKIGRLIEHYGEKVSGFSERHLTHSFPTPSAIANASLQEIGLTKVRAEALRAFARLVMEKKIDFSRTADIQATRDQLLKIHGFGPWTVEMIAMRCLGDTNALPKNDLIIQRALKPLAKKKSDWSPWNAYVTLALWKDHIQKLKAKKEHDALLKKN